MGMTLDRDTIAGMAAAAIRGITERKDAEEARRAKEVAERMALYACAEQHAQPLIDGLNIVRNLSEGRFDFKVKDNMDEPDHDAPDHIKTDPLRIRTTVYIELIGVGECNGSMDRTGAVT